MDAAAVWQVVLRLRQVAALAGAAGEVLPAAQPVWSGPAATAFTQARGAVEGRLGLAGGVAARVAEVLTTYAQAVEQAQAAVAACGRELAEVEAERQRRAVLVSVGLPDPGEADLGERVRAVRHRHRQVLDAYAGAVGAAARALAAVYEQVPASARGMSAGDRVEQGYRGFAQAALVEPVQGVWALTGEALTDRQAWGRTWRGLPAALWDQAVHPVRSTEQALGLDAWHDDDGGDWSHSLGITAGTAAGMVLGPVGKAAQAARAVEHASEHAAEHAAADAAEQALEKAPLQDLADTFDGVDLANHEANGGHTLKKHVDVTDDDLRERLEKRVASNRSAADLPDEQRDVSRFASREVAEEWITKTLKARADDIDRWLESGSRWSQEFDLEDVPPEIGIVLHVHPDGAITQERLTKVRVVLARNEQGVFVRTAYPMMAS